MGSNRLMTAKVMGADKIRATLARLPGQIQIGSIRPAMKESAEPVRQAIKANAPESVGRWAAYRRRQGHIQLESTIETRVRADKKRNADVAAIGPTVPSGAHGHFTEGGTTDRFAIVRDIAGQRVLSHIEKQNVIITRKSGKSYSRVFKRKVWKKNFNLRRGKVIATHWMKRAFESTVGAALNKMAGLIEGKMHAAVEKAKGNK